IGSGVIGGFLGPFVAGHGIMMFDRYPYLGAFLIAAVIFLLVLATQNFINLPHTTPSPAVRTDAPGNGALPGQHCDRRPFFYDRHRQLRGRIRHHDPDH
ncbi:hypothetical protein CVE36_17630, partial [Pseudomonas syringae pv. actinidiae]|nr:hypothetical protein [Pseudomonas syringae pv. actinidiae]